MRLLFFLLCLYCAITISHCLTTLTDTPTPSRCSYSNYALEHDAIQALYSNLNGMYWKTPVLWTEVPDDHCSPFFVCDSSCAVLEIQLKDSNLRGVIPIEIGNFQRLKILKLNLNMIGGTIPSELGKLTNLEQLYLNNNAIVGNLPLSLCQLPNLRTLHVGFNSLSGNLTDCALTVSRSTSLINFYVLSNRFNGSVPSFSGTATSSLSQVIASNNTFITIDKFSNFPKLNYVDISNCQISGVFPTFENVPYLQSVYMHGNNFTGSLDAFWKERCKSRKLIYIKLDFNPIASIDFSRSCVCPFDPVEKLGVLSARYLMLTETAVDFLFNDACPMRTVDVSGNPTLRGDISRLIKAMQTPEFLDINIASTTLSGHIVSNIFLRKLRSFVIDFTNVTFDPPYSLEDGSMWGMQQLCMAGIPLSPPGLIPKWMGYLCNTLTVLVVSHASITGTWVDNFQRLYSCIKLTKLDLGSNSISGSFSGNSMIPWKYLQKFCISHNQLTGPIPDDMFMSCKDSIDFINLSFNQFTGAFNGKAFRNMPKLKQLYVFSNQFSSMKHIDLQLIMENPNLERLSFHDNFIAATNLFNPTTGISIATYGRKITVLTAYNNRIRGSISQDFVMLPNLEQLLLHNNILSCALPLNSLKIKKDKSITVLGNQFELPRGNVNWIQNAELQEELFVRNFYESYFLTRMIPIFVIVCTFLFILTTREGWRRTYRALKILSNHGVPTMRLLDSNNDDCQAKSLTAFEPPIFVESYRRLLLVNLQCIYLLASTAIVIFIVYMILIFPKDDDGLFHTCEPDFSRLSIETLHPKERDSWILAALLLVVLIIIILFLIKYLKMILAFSDFDRLEMLGMQRRVETSEFIHRPSQVRWLDVIFGAVLSSLMYLLVLGLNVFYILIQNLPYNNVMFDNQSMLQDIIGYLIPLVIAFCTDILFENLIIKILTNIVKLSSEDVPISFSYQYTLLLLITKWLVPIIFVVFLDQGCFGYYKYFWIPCRNDMFDITDPDVIDRAVIPLVSSEDICSSSFRYGFCSRRVVSVVGLLLFRVLVFKAFLVMPIKEFFQHLILINSIIKSINHIRKTILKSVKHVCQCLWVGSSPSSSPSTSSSVTDIISIENRRLSSIETPLLERSSSTTPDEIFDEDDGVHRKSSLAPAYINLLLDVSGSLLFGYFYPSVIIVSLFCICGSLLFRLYVRCSGQVVSTVLPVNEGRDSLSGSSSDNTIGSNTMNCDYVANKSIPFIGRQGLLKDVYRETFTYDFLPSPLLFLVLVVNLPAAATVYFFELRFLNIHLLCVWLIVASLILFYIVVGYLCILYKWFKHILVKRTLPDDEEVSKSSTTIPTFIDTNDETQKRRTSSLGNSLFTCGTITATQRYDHIHRSSSAYSRLSQQNG